MFARPECQGVVEEPQSTSTMESAKNAVVAEKAETLTTEPYNHPAFRNDMPYKSADSAVGSMHNDSTASDSASFSASGATGSIVTGTSEHSDKFVGGSHQMNDVKLPGYWSHYRTLEIRAMAKKDSNIQAAGTSTANSKAAPLCNECEEEKKKKEEEEGRKKKKKQQKKKQQKQQQKKQQQGLFKAEFKRKGFFNKMFRRRL